MSEKQKILVADDDPDIVEQLSVILTSQGYEVATAASQQETEDVLLGFQPDLAIVDLMMEHTDSGFVLCHLIKKLYPETAIILLTSVTAQTGMSFDTQSEIERSWIKADKIMDKPVRAEQFRAEIHRLLRTAAVPQQQKH
ncbi:MAG: response regulator [bacterium]